MAKPKPKGKGKPAGKPEPKAAPKPRKKAAPTPRDDGRLDRQREAVRAHHAEASRSGRDVGPICNVGNVRRRAKCRASLRQFCETYNPAAFYLGWSSDH